jgi:hypothetical protein
MQIVKHATALQILLEIIVSPVRHHDSGIIIQKNVHAPLRKLNGIHQPKNANAQLESMETFVFNVLLLDTGI